MKKCTLTLSLLAILISASAYARSQIKTQENLGTSPITTEKPVTNQYQPQDKLPDKYLSDLAEKNGDVVNVKGKVANLDKIIKFIEDYESKKSTQGDMVRITNYTTEGDAIITDLIIDSTGMKLIEDTTRDEFSNAEGRKRTEYGVTAIQKSTKPEGITYTTKTDKGEEVFLFYEPNNK